MGSEGRAALGSSMVSSVRVDGVFRLHCSGVWRGRVDWFGFDASPRRSHRGRSARVQARGWRHAEERPAHHPRKLSDKVGARRREASVTVGVYLQPGLHSYQHLLSPQRYRLL